MQVCEYYEVIQSDSLNNLISLAKFETRAAACEFVMDRTKKPFHDLSIQKVSIVIIIDSILIYRNLVEYKSREMQEIKQQALAKLDPLEIKALGLS